MFEGIFSFIMLHTDRLTFDKRLYDIFDIYHNIIYNTVYIIKYDSVVS